MCGNPVAGGCEGGEGPHDGTSGGENIVHWIEKIEEGYKKYFFLVKNL